MSVTRRDSHYQKQSWHLPDSPEGEKLTTLKSAVFYSSPIFENGVQIGETISVAYIPEPRFESIKNTLKAGLSTAERRALQEFILTDYFVDDPPKEVM